MRRFVAGIVTALMLANLAAWHSAVLAEALEHATEAVQAEGNGQKAPDAPSASHCRHGCAGHYGQHFQWQVTVSHISLRVAVSSSVDAAPEYFSLQHISTLPFRPPLHALIRS